MGRYLRQAGERAELILGGRRYRWCGWFGCQLESSEWRRPPAGTEREIVGRRFRVFTTKRAGLKVLVTWALALPHSHLDKAVPELLRDLQDMV